MPSRHSHDTTRHQHAADPGLPVPTPRNVTDFRDLYRRRFGVDLAWDDAAETLTRLMQFVHLVERANRTRFRPGVVTQTRITHDPTA